MLPIAFYGVEKEFEIPTEDQKAMLRWLYVANYKGHYSGSVETTLDVDLRTIRETQRFESLLTPLQTRFGRLHIEAGDLVGKGERSGLFSLAYLALKHDGAKDWKTGLGLSLTHQGHLHYIEYHHIFPKSVLAKGGFERSEINEIANMAFISGKLNRQISNKSPKEYLPLLISTRGADAITKQAIPLQEDLWELTNYRLFLEHRRESLARAINAFVERTVSDGGVVSSDT